MKTLDAEPWQCLQMREQREAENQLATFHTSTRQGQGSRERWLFWGFHLTLEKGLNVTG